jgi:hypothetical protein
MPWDVLWGALLISTVGGYGFREWSRRKLQILARHSLVSYLELTDPYCEMEEFAVRLRERHETYMIWFRTYREALNEFPPQFRAGDRIEMRHLVQYYRTLACDPRLTARGQWMLQDLARALEAFNRLPYFTRK